MFLDEVFITVSGGAGGNGCVSFRREKFLPRGGPDGGDGGDGGTVTLRADGQRASLAHFHRQREFTATRGIDGGSRNCTGARGAALVLPVPRGTRVKDAATGLELADLQGEGEELLVARGGRGGRGNRSFARATRQAPRLATDGEPGATRTLALELALIADVGLVGQPNAGKSTLLARLSAARPRVAAYPFTTVEPQLGLVVVSEEDDFVLADLPGLIAGAHAGAGLGDRFLRHLERTRVLLHLVELVPSDGSDPAAHLRVIETELAAFSPALAAKPRMVVGTKADLSGAEAARLRLSAVLGLELRAISAHSGAGLEELVKSVTRALRAQRQMAFDSADR